MDNNSASVNKHDVAVFRIILKSFILWVLFVIVVEMQVSSLALRP